MDGKPKTEIVFDTLYDTEIFEDLLRKVIDEIDVKVQPTGETIEKIVRRWTKITVGDVEKLTGGTTEAGVYRFRAEIGIPEFGENSPRIILPSLIIKTNTKEAFRKEFENYQRLPSVLRDRFAKMESFQEPIVQRSRGGREIIYYMIMEDLIGYRPLNDILYKERHDQAYADRLVDYIWKNLKIIHNFKEDKRIVSRFGSMYIGPMQEALAKAVEKHEVLKQTVLNGLTVGGNKLLPIDEYWPKLFVSSDSFEPPFLAYVHGDFHSKNILVKDLTKQEETEFEVKFIDIDKMEDNGDYIFDIGELIAYIEVIGPVLAGQLQTQPKTEGDDFAWEATPNQTVSWVREGFSRKLKEIEGNDAHYKSRLFLAQARALFSFLPYVENSSQAMILYCEGLKRIEQSLDKTQ